MKKTKGFTLIELLLTLLIMGLLVGIASLRFDFLNQYQERLEIKSVIMTINEARNKAVVSGYSSIVEFDRRENIVQVYEEGEVVEKIYLKHIAVKGDNNRIKFNSTGAPNKAGEYLFEGQKKKYFITIEIATGKVNLDEKEI